MTTKPDQTFEEALAELEETVSLLETGDMPLDKSLALFERGQTLAAYCNEMLESAVLRVAQLTVDGEEREVVKVES